MQPLTEKLILSDLPDVFTDEDLHHLLDEPSPAARHGLVKRALAKDEIITIRRGLYILAGPYRRDSVDLYYLAGRIVRPSYISLESALSAHGWIPERVVSITSCSFKRARDFVTPLGRFEYRRSPFGTLIGVEYRANAQRTRSLPYLVASPLRALADLAHDHRNLAMEKKPLGLDVGGGHGGWAQSGAGQAMGPGQWAFGTKARRAQNGKATGSNPTQTPSTISENASPLFR